MHQVQEKMNPSPTKWQIGTESSKHDVFRNTRRGTGRIGVEEKDVEVQTMSGSWKRRTRRIKCEKAWKAKQCPESDGLKPSDKSVDMMKTKDKSNAMVKRNDMPPGPSHK